MLQKQPPVKVDEQDPFKNDVLDRKECAEVLTPLIQSLSQPFVLCVHGTYGSGKTTFVQMWKQLLSNEGHPCMYFNAWENDFVGDPLVALLEELETFVSSESSSDSNNALKAPMETLKRLGIGMLRRSTPLAIRLGTGGLLDFDTLQAVVPKSLSEKIPDLLADTAKGHLDSTAQGKSVAEQFKETLGEFVAQIANDDDSKRKPVICFIDELDRCRPTFAIELLERVKHLFSVPDMVFVLAVDRNQLAQAARSLYGTDLDTPGFLRRLIDLEFQLPDPSIEKYTHFLYERFDLAAHLQDRGNHWDAARSALRLFSDLAEAFHFSLRDVEHCFTRLDVAIRTTPRNSEVCLDELAILVALKHAVPDGYAEYVAGHTDAEPLLDRVREARQGQAFLDSRNGMFFEAIVRSGSKRQDTGQVCQRAQAVVDATEGETREKEVAKFIVHLCQKMYSPDRVMSYCAGRVDFTKHFR